MAKALILKHLTLGEQQLQNILKQYPALSSDDVEKIKNWQQVPGYTGTHIQEDAFLKVLPWEEDEKEYLIKNPDGKVLNQEDID